MTQRSILFIGRDSGTSRHRAKAFERLGFEVCVIDPFSLLPESRFVGLWIWHTGSLFLEDYIRRGVLAKIPNRLFDFAYVDGGELVGASLVVELRKRCGSVINYQIDDPFSPRDGRRWRFYSKAMPLYDLVVVVRQCNVSEARQAGARDVIRVHMSADEIAHAPREITPAERKELASEVLFVGTWMPERGPFLARLIKLGVPLAIYGCRWQKASEWSVLRSAWRGPGLYDDDRYARALQCAKVNLGLLSKGNRDQSTTRSFEIPALEANLCAERTPEHMKLYHENSEAVFWSDAEECASKCFQLLTDENLRHRLGSSGRRRCLQNETMNEDVLAKILDRIGFGNKKSERLQLLYKTKNLQKLVSLSR